MTPLTIVITSDRYGAENDLLDRERGLVARFPDITATVTGKSCRSEADLIAVGQYADAMLLSTREAVTASLCASIPQTKVIARYGVGLDNVDLDAATRHGIVVTHYPQYCTDEVADHAVSGLLALNRRLVQLDRALHDGEWGAHGPLTRSILLGPVPALRTQTIGVVGFGRIGRTVVKRLQPFGSTILVHDPYADPSAIAAAGAQAATLADLVANSDLITLHCPLTPETRGLINADLLSHVKPGVGIVNTARGPIVDQSALVEFLESHPKAQAMLDVVEVEPLPLDSPLFQLPNVVLTPHSAYYSEQSVETVREQTFLSALAVLRGYLPPTVANPEVLSTVQLR